MNHYHTLIRKEFYDIHFAYVYIVNAPNSFTPNIILVRHGYLNAPETSILKKAHYVIFCRAMIKARFHNHMAKNGDCYPMLVTSQRMRACRCLARQEVWISRCR
jgi:hypothetical protein